ncbi:MAG: phosphoribosylformylglycinamidine cyclo-ligase [Bdellovibrio sp. CG10_big_fil_rev_8_21_14_0_10_47_8]|nr:MAG: phosphoribosylformylglycinamidine cyclo-ligase [Bdellovibrio sp. CG10_big_fil_rev_8_21_14_0_10_47_8]
MFLEVVMDYKSSGVDIEAGDALVDWLAETENQKQMPHRERIVSGIGGFASLFRASFPEMKKPCLVTCTDGVGTKVKLAAQYQKLQGIGQDLVAMCVNDLICTGGEPLMFLDYYATGQLRLDEAKVFLASVRQACIDSDCALVGGETAEMPGVYHDRDFDCAGFAVGIVDEEKTLGPKLVQKGDRVLGISSSGFHSNGYSLLRQVFAQDMDQWVDRLLTPTALYVHLARELRKNTELHALAHITGGGVENIPRVLPPGMTWKMKAWAWPEAFLEVQKRTKMSDEKMLVTLNCGIGLVAILPGKDLDAAKTVISGQGFEFFEIGEIQ